MTDKVTLTNLANLQNEVTAVTAINDNNIALTAAVNNTLSRDGTAPNQMQATLDMNNQQIINLPAPSTINSPARLVDVVTNPTVVLPGTGTSGHVVPFLDGNNTWSGTNTYSTTSTFNGAATFTNTVTIPNNTITYAELVTSIQGLINSRVSKSANYTVTNADKGSTIALNGSTYFTLTFASPGSYDANFMCLVVNEDTTRGKLLSIVGLSNIRLYPGQSILIFNQNNVWKVFPKDHRYIIPGNFTFYVDVTNGNDANDGLAPGSGNALKTIQNAIGRVCSDIDLAGLYSAFIQLADGTYPESLTLGGYVGFGPLAQNTVTIQGNSGNHDAVILAPPSGNAVTSVGVADMWKLANLRLTSLASGVEADAGSFVSLQGVNFGACSIGVQALFGSTIEFLGGNYTIGGNMAAVEACGQRGLIIHQGGSTVTITGTPAFGVFASAQDLGLIYAVSTTYVGAATGQRYAGASNSVINTGGGGANYFPGNSAGTVGSGAVYE